MATIEVSLVTPDGSAFEGEAEMLIVPGAAEPEPNLELPTVERTLAVHIGLSESGIAGNLGNGGEKRTAIQLRLDERRLWSRDCNGGRWALRLIIGRLPLLATGE